MTTTTDNQQAGSPATTIASEPAAVPAALFSSQELPPTGRKAHSGVSLRTNGEPIIERALTFGESTFEALSVFVHEHQEATGKRLTKAAAVDWLLRRQLGRSGPSVREALFPPGFDQV